MRHKKESRRTIRILRAGFFPASSKPPSKLTPNNQVTFCRASTPSCSITRGGVLTFRRASRRVSNDIIPFHSTGESNKLLPIYICVYYVCGHHRYQPGMVANPARSQLNRENGFFPVPFAAESLVSRVRFGCPVPRQPAHSPRPG